MSLRRPTLADVAARAGVSVSTASLAFSGAGPIADDTRTRIRGAAEELGYSGPSPLGRSLRSGRSGIVGVVLGDRLRRGFRDPVAVQVLDGLVRTLSELGLGVLLVPSGSDDDALVTMSPLIETAAMDVAILLWGVIDGDPTLESLQRRGVPMLAVEGPEVEGVPLIAIDDRRGTTELVNYLKTLGHERFAMVTLPYSNNRRTRAHELPAIEELELVPTRHRYLGMLDAGITPMAIIESAGSLVEEGQAAARLLLQGNDRPTAIVAQSDLLASGVVLAARELGLRVPEDVSVAGFDGIEVPWLAPDLLTTICQPLAEKGAAIGRAVKQILEGTQPPSLMMPVTLRAGTTTGPPPA